MLWQLLFVLVNIPSLVQSQFCRRFNSTWSGFIDVVQSIEQSSGYDILCSFEISGDDDCPTPDEYPLGYQIRSSLILICDPDLFGYQDESECIINCPGVHFSLEESASLTLDGFTLAGATNSSIHLEEQATLRLINSNMRENNAGDNNNGGAIRAMGQKSKVEVEYSKFGNNEGFIGGAIYTAGDLRILQTIFTDNISPVAGGAIASLPSGDINIRRSSFHRNEAATGGALYMLRVVASLLSNTFTDNYAIDGGAVHNGGRSSINESVFMDNYAENGGGAINCEAGSFTTINRSEFINNNAGNVGPAVHDRFNTRVLKADNTACGNAVSTGNSDCDGVLIRLNRRRAKCLSFSDICIAPTAEPSVLPSSLPTMSLSPSAKPSSFPSAGPSSQPTKSSVPSVQPSALPTSSPSSSPSLTPTSSSSPSDSPSFSPSSLPSLSVAPSLLPSFSPSSTPSVSIAPSLTPSENPSSMPSETPSNEPTSSIAPSTHPSVSVEPTASLAPSDVPSAPPTLMPSTVPTTVPTASVVPSHAPSSQVSTISDIEDLTDFNSTETSAAASSSSSAGTRQRQRRMIETASNRNEDSKTEKFAPPAMLQLRRRLNN